MAETSVGLQMSPASKECEHVSESRTSIKFPTSLMSSSGIRKPSYIHSIRSVYLLVFVTLLPLFHPLTYENEYSVGFSSRI